jgi:hypothetical protein
MCDPIGGLDLDWDLQSNADPDPGGLKRAEMKKNTLQKGR